MNDSPIVALLTIRTWYEKGSSNPLRAEIRTTSDVTSGFQTVWTVTERRQVLNAVRAFLTEVCA